MMTNTAACSSDVAVDVPTFKVSTLGEVIELVKKELAEEPAKPQPRPQVKDNNIAGAKAHPIA